MFSIALWKFLDLTSTILPPGVLCLIIWISQPQTGS